ncbi:MAG: hypothetical protein IT160_00760 [Bryobacterales bacterium]|nr:hypothetical protein [Bryobacterales bacterium]
MSSAADADNASRTLPAFLLPETVVSAAGNGPGLWLGEAKGRTLAVTLGITRIIEQESLDVSVWGSPDQTTWTPKALAAFPQKFYCGTYRIVLDLGANPEIEFLRVQYKMERWGRGGQKPLFGFYVFAEVLK